MQSIINYFLKPSLSKGNLQSVTIDRLRFPLAIAVVFLHSFGNISFNIEEFHGDVFSYCFLYNTVRIFFSRVFPHFAVPTFYLISGYLFFYNVDKFDISIYKNKLLKRIKSIFVPYICWIVIYFIFIFIKGCLQGTNNCTLASLYDFYVSKGGVHIFWDSVTWGLNYVDLLGNQLICSGPLLGPLWFLRDLMVVIVFVPILFYMIREWGGYFIGFLSLFAISHIWFRICGISIDCIFWFSLGAWFSIKHINMFVLLSKYQFSFVLSSVFLSLYLIWNNGRVGDGITVNYISNIVYNLYAFTSVGMIMSISYNLIKRTNKKTFELYPRLATATFFIFVVHQPIIQEITPFVEDNISSLHPIFAILGFFLTPIIVIITSLFVFYFLDMIMPSVLCILVGRSK